MHVAMSAEKRITENLVNFSKKKKKQNETNHIPPGVITINQPACLGKGRSVIFGELIKVLQTQQNSSLQLDISTVIMSCCS